MGYHRLTANRLECVLYGAVRFGDKALPIVKICGEEVLLRGFVQILAGAVRHGKGGRDAVFDHPQQPLAGIGACVERRTEQLHMPAEHNLEERNRVRFEQVLAGRQRHIIKFRRIFPQVLVRLVQRDRLPARQLFHQRDKLGKVFRPGFFLIPGIVPI